MSNKPLAGLGEMIAETGFNAFGLMTPKQVFDALKRHDKEIAKLKKEIKTLKRQVNKSARNPSQPRERKRKKRETTADDFDDDDYDPL